MPDPLIDFLEDPWCCLGDVRRALDEGAGMEEGFTWRWSMEPKHPVVLAAACHDPRILELILSRGGDPNCRDKAGQTPLHAAVAVAHAEVLFSYGAKYPEALPEVDTPLAKAYADANRPIALLLLRNGASIDELWLSEVHKAVLLEPRTAQEVLAREPYQLEWQDSSGRTPLLLAFQLGDVETAKTLLAGGADKAATTRDLQSVMDLAVVSDSVEAIQFAESCGFDPCPFVAGGNPIRLAAEGNCVKSLKYLLARLRRCARFREALDEACWDVHSLEATWMLLDAGASLDNLSQEGRRLLNPSRTLGLWLDDISKEEFEKSRRPREGASNPEECSERFWQAMVVSRDSGCTPRRRFGADLYTMPREDPVWCADRLGQTITRLPDGRTIEVGGEHEDSYDPDFCIYNDVIVHEPGVLPRIYLYPERDFPPTDFHSATLVGEWLYLIGNLGYWAARNQPAKVTHRLILKDIEIEFSKDVSPGIGVCPVFRLNINTMKIENVETAGDDPGRIYKHRATLIEPNRILVEDGMRSMNDRIGEAHPPTVLDISTGEWSIHH